MRSLMALVLLAAVPMMAAPSLEAIEAGELSLTFAILVSTTPVPNIFSPLPMPKRQPMPEYPMEMRHEGVSGMAVLRLTIDKRGVVTDVAVTRATRPEFAAAARSCIPAWEFVPATEDGKAVDCAVDYTFEFRIIVGEPNQPLVPTPGNALSSGQAPQSGAAHL